MPGYFEAVYNTLIAEYMPGHIKYSRITLQKRKRLVDMVIRQKISIIRASSRLSLKEITARFIINKYMNQGTFTVKKSDKTVSNQQAVEVNEEEIKEEQMIRPETNEVHQEDSLQRQETRDTANEPLIFWGWIFNGLCWQLCPYFT